MIIRVVSKERNYTRIENSSLEDRNLSFRAKGILAYLLSKKDDWTVVVQDLMNRSPKEGRDAIRAAMEELRANKYAYIFLVKDKVTKKLKGRQWVIYEVPTEISTEEQWVEEGEEIPTDWKNREPENPTVGKTDRRESPTVGKTLTSNNSSLSKDGKNSKEGTPIVPKPVEVIELKEVNEVAGEWKKAGLPEIRNWSQKRLKTLNARMKDAYFRSNWCAGIKKVGDSDFCAGKNERGWRADIEWFLRDGTIEKIMEGKYDNRGGSSSERSIKDIYNDPSL
jgi:hypothetical protein